MAAGSSQPQPEVNPHAAAGPVAGRHRASARPSLRWLVPSGGGGGAQMGTGVTVLGLGMWERGDGGVSREPGVIRCSWNNLLFFLNLPRSPKAAQ